MAFREIWSFAVREEDQAAIHAEMDRLQKLAPGIRATKSDAIRALINRASTITDHVEEEAVTS